LFLFISFQVRCAFDWGGATYPFERTNFSTDLTWSMMTNGYGNPAHSNFFVGMDNLHYLTSQASLFVFLLLFLVVVVFVVVDISLTG
jgi:hypothetical protein